MSVRTELTWEYESQGYTPENSIKGILFGEEIASGYIGLFTTASTQDMNESQLIAGVKASGKALTTAQLEKINGTGYAPFYTGLSAGTSYTLLVYADNGYNGKLFAVEQTTAGKADPLQRKYTIDDLYVFSDKAQLFKTWNLWGISNDGSGKRIAARSARSSSRRMRPTTPTIWMQSMLRASRSEPITKTRLSGSGTTGSSMF